MANNLEFLCRIFFTHTSYPPGQYVFLTFTKCSLYLFSIVIKHLNIGKGPFVMCGSLSVTINHMLTWMCFRAYLTFSKYCPVRVVYCGQVSLCYIQYLLRYELFSPILVTARQTTDILQKVMHMSPPCKVHRWAKIWHVLSFPVITYYYSWKYYLRLFKDTW